MTDTLFNRITKNKPLQSVSFSLHDLENIAKIISDRNEYAIQIEHSFIQASNAAPEQQNEFLKIVSDNQKVSIFINGGDGENIIAYDSSVFQSHLLPVLITNITIETQTYRQVRAKSDPPNFIRFQVDFSKLQFGSPKFAPNGTLLNTSALQIQGTDEGWVASSFKALEDRINAARNGRSFLHNPGTYEVGLLIFAFPALIFLLDQIYRNHQEYFDSLGIITRIGAVSYAFLAGVLTYRLLFNYGLWAFPSVELINDRDTAAKHRKFWFSLTSGLIIAGISYYIFK